MIDNRVPNAVLMESSYCRTQKIPREEIPQRLELAAREAGAPEEMAAAAACAVWEEFWAREGEPSPWE